MVIGILFFPLFNTNIDLQRPYLEESHKTKPFHLFWNFANLFTTDWWRIKASESAFWPWKSDTIIFTRINTILLFNGASDWCYTFHKNFQVLWFKLKLKENLMNLKVFSQYLFKLMIARANQAIDVLSLCNRISFQTSKHCL